MFVLSHFFSTLFYNTTQFITSFASNGIIKLAKSGFQNHAEANRPSKGGQVSDYTRQSASDDLIKPPANDNLTI
jgi:hypothetical protein